MYNIWRQHNNNNKATFGWCAFVSIPAAAAIPINISPWLPRFHILEIVLKFNFDRTTETLVFNYINQERVF